MKKIGDFLFVEQCFADIEETKPCIININAIDSITQSCNNKHGNVAVIETDNFFTEFENLISEEEW
jgi:hypothetical protein